jgi:Leucine-rich repeat (LRR) protein
MTEFISPRHHQYAHRIILSLTDEISPHYRYKTFGRIIEYYTGDDIATEMCNLNVEILYLSRSSVECIRNFPNLKILIAEYSSRLKEIKDCPLLEEIHLRFNRQIVVLEGFPNLRKVYAGNYSVLAYLSGQNITYLDINNNRCMQFIHALPELRCISACGSVFKGAVECPNLQQLHLCNNRSCRAIIGYNQLRILSIEGDSAVQLIADCDNLENVSLIANRHCHELYDLPKLKCVYATRNYTLLRIEKCPNLRYIVASIGHRITIDRQVHIEIKY